MNRKQLEHVLRAGGSLTSSRDLVVIGSQAILVSFPNAPADMLTSMEADVYPMDAPEKTDMIDGCIGELSPFHETFGYYAHRIGPETAVLPAKWKTRLVRVTNVGKVPLPGLLPSDLGNGEPCLFIGWGFSRKENEDFAFQGNYPSNSSIAPGESREFTMKAWAEDPKMKFFRVGLWVSRKENTGFIGGPLRNRVAQRAEIPTTFRDNSRKSLLFAFVVCNAFFLIYLGFHFKNKRKTQVS